MELGKLGLFGTKPGLEGGGRARSMCAERECPPVESSARDRGLAHFSTRDEYARHVLDRCWLPSGGWPEAKCLYCLGGKVETIVGTRVTVRDGKLDAGRIWLRAGCCVWRQWRPGRSRPWWAGDAGSFGAREFGAGGGCAERACEPSGRQRCSEWSWNLAVELCCRSFRRHGAERPACAVRRNRPGHSRRASL
jgi:hypothetical protein